jgi:ribosomal protein S18 acetylase RimI-like enzyme
LNGCSPTIVPGDPATSLRPAADADAPFIRELFKAGRAADFAAAALPPRLLDTLLEQQFRAQSADYAIQFPDAATHIISRHEAPVGRLILASSDRRWRIVDILLRPEARGCGIGGDVIAAVAHTAAEHGVCDVTLSVLSNNAGARRLYLRLGFVETGANDAYVEMARILNAETPRSPSGS